MPIIGRPQDEFSKFEYALESELLQIQQYIDGLAFFIKKNQQGTKKFVDEEIWTEKAEGPPLIALEIYSQVDHHTPRLFYRSSLTVLYSFFETTFHALTSAVIKKWKFRLILSDLKGQGILRDKLFLDKVVGLDLKALDSLWSGLNDVREIRNHMVHDSSDSIVNNRSGNLKRICDVNKYLEFYEPDGPVEIASVEYLRYVKDLVDVFLKLLILILRNHNV